MNKEDLQLIQQEFNSQKETNMKNGTITKSLINNLLNKYNSISYTELYYDKEPDISYEEWKRLQETREGKLKYKQMVKEYEPKRKRFNNWCELNEEGIWGYTNSYIRSMAKRILNKLKKHTYKENRFYIGEYENKTILYFYGRDIDQQMDYWFCFWNEDDNERKICDKCKRRVCWEECDKLLKSK